MKIEIELIPLKNGRLGIKPGDKIWWINKVPHRLEIRFSGEKVNEG